MKESNQLLTDIAEGLKNTEQNVIYYLDTKAYRVIKTSKDLSRHIARNNEVITIEPILKDILELMEDFALEQETDEIQNHLLSILKNREDATALENFYKALYDYPRSKKRWQKLESRWLKERAREFLEDFTT
jgi:hypothetical protein